MKIRIWFYTAIIIELGLFTFWQKSFGIYVSPVLWLCAGLTIGIFPLWYMYHKKYDSDEKSSLSRLRQLKFITTPIALVLLGLVAYKILNLFGTVQPDTYTDVYLQAKTMANRAITGEKVYSPIPLAGYTLYPTYLPFQWGPFILAVFTGLEARLIPLFAWLSVSLLVIVWAFRSRGFLLEKSLLMILPVGLLSALVLFQQNALNLSFELLIAGYYLFTILMFKKFNGWLIASGILLCLLSRYAIVLWVPFFLLLLFLYKKNGDAFKIAGVIGAGIVLFYLIPFFIYDSTIFAQGYKYHTVAAEGEWMDWNIFPEIEPAGPINVVNGIGMSVFFYKWLGGEIIERINILRLVHLALSVLVLLVLAYLFSKEKFRKSISLPIAAISTLKIYLVVFYSFIQIPYPYLFMVPFAVSIGLACLFLEELNKKLA